MDFWWSRKPFWKHSKNVISRRDVHIFWVHRVETRTWTCNFKSKINCFFPLANLTYYWLSWGEWSPKLVQFESKLDLSLKIFCSNFWCTLNNFWTEVKNLPQLSSIQSKKKLQLKNKLEQKLSCMFFSSSSFDVFCSRVTSSSP